MLLLTSTSDLIRITTTNAAGTLNVQASFVDYNGTTVAPNRTNTTITNNVTNSTIVGSPGASTQRNVKRLSIYNAHATNQQTVTVNHFDGTTSQVLVTKTLNPQVTLYLDDNGEWLVFDPTEGVAAGADTQLLFNDTGSIGADSDLTWNKTTNTLTLGGTDTEVVMAGITTEPSAPSSGKLALYTKNIGGRMMPKWIGPSGVDTPFQSFLGANGIRQLAPAGGTTATTVAQAFGCGYTAVATTFASPAPATGSLLGRTCRWTQATSSTAGTLGSVRLVPVQCSMETGFFYVVRFFISGTIQSGQRMFVGLWDASGAATNVDPLADTTRAKLGVGHNVATGNWFTITNTSGVAPTTADQGANFPLNTTDLFELILYCAPNGSSVSYRLTNLTSGNQTSGNFASNLPSSTVMLSPQVWVTNNATAAVSTMGLCRLYLETDN